MFSQTLQENRRHLWRSKSGREVAQSRGPTSHQWSADEIQDTRPEVGRTGQKDNNAASSGQNKDNKRSGVKQKGQEKVADGNTKSIHDNPTTEDKIKLIRQHSEGKVPNRQKQTTKCRSVTCNRVSGKTTRVQRTTQVVQETKQATTNAYSIRMHTKF